MRRMHAIFIAISASLPLLWTPAIHAEDSILDDSKLDNATRAELQADLDQVREGLGLISIGVPEAVKAGAHFIWKHAPNIHELKYDVVLCSAIDMLTAGYIDLGDSPAARSVVRDLSKTITVGFKAATGTQIGGTGIIYDTANVCAQIAKPISKGACIFGLQRLGMKGESASELCNFPGDTISQSMVLSGEEIQKANSSQTFQEHYTHSFPRLIESSTVQILWKTGVVTGISHVIKYFGLGTKINSGVFGFGGLASGVPLVSKLTKAQIDAGATILQLNTGLLSRGGYRRYSALGISTLVSLVSGIGTNLMNTILLATSAKSTMAFVNMKMKENKEWIDGWKGWAFNWMTWTYEPVYFYFFPVQKPAQESNEQKTEL